VLLSIARAAAARMRRRLAALDHFEFICHRHSTGAAELSDLIGVYWMVTLDTLRSG
jgi:hypothetical protein